MPVRVAIHQPNFFPWLGYFDKISKADVFIFLDAVDYPRAGSGGMGSWCNRVKIAVGGSPRWIGCPVRRAPSGTPILATLIDDSQPWRRRLLQTLATNYGRAARFQHGMPIVEALVHSAEDNLAEFNIRVVTEVARHLGLETTFIRQSALPKTEAKATELLIFLVESVGGDTYLAGGGAEGYQQDTLFAERAIRLEYQGFRPCAYGDATTFLPGLSVIDYLMRDGRPLELTLRGEGCSTASSCERVPAARHADEDAASKRRNRC